MANSNFVIDQGLTVGALSVTATAGDLTTTGNVTMGSIKMFAGNGDIITTGNVSFGSSAVGYDNMTVGGNITLSQTATLSTAADTVQPKQYIDVMTVVFGS
jgi:hypothetical protein